MQITFYYSDYQNAKIKKIVQKNKIIFLEQLLRVSISSDL